MKNNFLFLSFLSCYTTYSFGSQQADFQLTQLSDAAIEAIFNNNQTTEIQLHNDYNYSQNSLTDTESDNGYGYYSQPLPHDNPVITHQQTQNENSQNNNFHSVSQNSQHDAQDIPDHQINRNRLVRVVTLDSHNN